MIRRVLLGLSIVSFLVACAPVSGTYTYYKAVGTNAKTQSPCGAPRSRFIYSLASGTAPRVEVSMRAGRPGEHVVSVAGISRADMSVLLDPSKVMARFDGRVLRPVSTQLVAPTSRGNLVFTSLTAIFTPGSVSPRQIVVTPGTGAVRVNGADFALPPMVFNLVSETHSGLMPANC